MIDLANLGIVAATFFVAAASPGPATLAVSTVAISAGRSAGMLFGLGLSIGLAFWGVIAATGLGAILQTSAAALTILKLIGGAYLIWLAYLSGRSAMEVSEKEPDCKTAQHYFRSGLFLNLSNPKAVLAWMAVLALGLGGESVALQMTISTLSCSVLGLLIYTAYAFVFSTKHAMSLYRRVRRRIEGAVAVLFALAGFGLIKSALSR